MTDLEWVDPPQRSGRRSRPGIWAQRLAPVAERPGQWARVYKSPNPKAAASTVSNLRSGRSKPPEGVWEFEFDDEGYIYARTNPSIAELERQMGAVDG